MRSGNLYRIPHPGYAEECELMSDWVHGINDLGTKASRARARRAMWVCVYRVR